MDYTETKPGGKKKSCYITGDFSTIAEINEGFLPLNCSINTDEWMHLRLACPTKHIGQVSKNNNKHQTKVQSMSNYGEDISLTHR